MERKLVKRAGTRLEGQVIERNSETAMVIKLKKISSR